MEKFDQFEEAWNAGMHQVCGGKNAKTARIVERHGGKKDRQQTTMDVLDSRKTFIFLFNYGKIFDTFDRILDLKGKNTYFGKKQQHLMSFDIGKVSSYIVKFNVF